MRVVIAEDLALLRDGLIRLLRDTGFEVAAAVDHPDRFLEAVEEHRPDVCVVDVRLPPTFSDEGVRAALEARRRIPGLPILITEPVIRLPVAPGTDAYAGAKGGALCLVVSPTVIAGPGDIRVDIAAAAAQLTAELEEELKS